MAILQKSKNELYHILPVFLFFTIMFTVISSLQRFLFEKAGLTPITFIHLIIEAGLIAKIVLVIDHLPFVNLFSKMPLIYILIWKTLLYSSMTLTIRLSILLVPQFIATQEILFGYETFVDSMNGRLFTAIQVWNILLFFIFVTARELTQVIGKEKLSKIFFGK